jgi:ornithine cyclodeaminase
MSDISIFTEKEIRQCVKLDKSVIDIIDRAFASLSTDNVIMPAVLSMDLPEVNAEVDIKTAYIPGLDTFTIKVSPGFFDNPAKGLPSLNGLMVALSASTGIVKTVLLDNGYLTDIRTAAAGGVACRYLAPQQVKTIGILGAGMQSRLQLKAALLERDTEQVLVWNRSLASAQIFAAEMEDETGVSVKVADDIKTLVQASQLVITTTPSRIPLIKADWLHAGLHITAMGSDASEKSELDPAILDRAELFVVDRIQQSKERGEMRLAIDLGVLSSDFKAIELGDICSSKVLGRSNEDQITVCDLTGTGVQDTAISNYVQQVVAHSGFGTVIRN